MTHFKSDVDYSPLYPAAQVLARGLSVLRLCAGFVWVAVLVACAQTPIATTSEDVPPEPLVSPSPETVAAPSEASSSVPTSAPLSVVAPAPLAAAPMALPPVEPKPLAPAPKPAALVVTQELSPGYYVNVGAFAVPNNANKAYQKLQEAGLAPVAQTLIQRKRTLTRVGAGPFPTRAAAQAAAKKIAAIPLDTLISKHENAPKAKK